MAPERMCVGCRARAPQSTLVRFVVDSGRIVATSRPGVPGRGAYLHRDRRCLDAALKRGALPRALRTTVPVDDASLGDPGPA